MTDPIPVNPRIDEPILAAPSLGPSLPIQSSSLQSASKVELIPPPDQMALELKALRQQALSTQAGIQQLQLEQQNQPFSDVLSGLPLGLTPGTAWLGAAILILGAMLAWSGTDRLQARSMRNRQAFVDSDAPPGESQDLATLEAIVSARVTAAALHEAPSTLPPESEFPPDSTRREVAFDLDVNLENLLPIKAPLLQPSDSSSDKPVAKIAHAPEFDREAAADEVERVLKSLAKKRAARSRRPQKTDSTISPLPDNAMVNRLPFELSTDRRAQWDQSGANQNAALSPEQQPPEPTAEEVLQLEPPPDAVLLDLESQAEPMADLLAALPVLPTATPAQDSDEELDHEVQLALAQEFEALGLTLGARELATEVLGSPDSALSSDAHALLRQIEDQELANPATKHSVF